MKQTSHFDFGLDYRMAAHTGIGTYLRGITAGFTANGVPDKAKLGLFHAGDAGKSGNIYFDAPIYSILEQLNYAPLLKMCRLWHSPHYNIPYFHSRTKLVVTIHDIIHWKFRSQLSLPQRIYAQTMLRRAVESSDHIITVSQHTQRDLTEQFGADPSKITVIYNGVSPDFVQLSDEALEKGRERLNSYGIPESFYLYVGMLKPHKNVARLLRVYSDLWSRKKIKSGLVIVGAGSPDSEEMRLLAGMKDRVIHLPRLGAGELPLFYNSARALVHPSLYEGFGLTVAEAFACGTPVITTRRASLPEVAGEAACLIDGEDEQEMAEALIRHDEDSGIKERGMDARFRQACRFSWEKAALETSRVYEKILAS